jgi:hypothetical protein
MKQPVATVRRATNTVTTARGRGITMATTALRRNRAAAAAFGRRRPSKAPMMLALAAGLIGGVAAAVSLERLHHRLPRSAQRRIAVAKARIRGDRVGALLESTRGAHRTTPHSSALSLAADTGASEGQGDGSTAA